MCKSEYWRTASREASFDPKVAIHERKPVHADSVEEARKLVEGMPAMVIGGVAHQPTLIEKFSPTAVIDEHSHRMPIGEAITRLLEDQDERGVPPLSELRQLLPQ